MTDATLATGDFSSVEIISNDLIGADTAETSTTPEVDVPEVPNGFIALGLAPELIQAVKDLGFTQPTIVQQKTIPLAMQGHSEGAKDSRFIDLMVSSQTGSGKTAAFLLPVLHTLLTQQAQAEAKEREDYQRAVTEAAAKGEPAPKRAKRKDPTNPRHFSAPTPGALVVCPTRELAQQVAHDAIDLVQHCRGLRIANIVGGMPYQLQIAKLQNANLVVATPGRLLDLQRSMQIKLDQVQFLVVDEADRMLDLGFSDDLAEINQLTIARKQTMMFSATFAPRIQQLATRVMREPQRITIDNPQEKHANIKQVLFWADNAQHKRKLLDHWLRDTGINQAIVFASTQIECDGLANDLQQDGFDAVALHGALSQGLRNRRLMALRQGQVQILVATDVAARGIDVPTVTHVFNFGLPMKAEDYTHRIGRTGRAGRDGLAVTFAEFRDRRKIFDIEAFTRQPIKAEVVPGMEPQQRMPEAPRGGFGGRGGAGFGDRDRKFGGGRPAGGGFGGNRGGFGEQRGGFNDNRGGFAENRGGFGDRNASGPRIVGADSYQNNKPGGFVQRDERPAAPPREAFNYERKGGFNDRFAGDRNPGAAAPRGDFGARKPAFGKPAFSKPAGGGKVFVPRDAQKRFSKNDR
jgi:superfamily II DNA/RNA helicase